MGDAAWKKVEAIAAQQAGLVSREQVVTAGVSGKLLTRQGRALHRGLYSVGSNSDPAHREHRIALLLAGPEAVLSHRTAARVHRLWGIDGFPMDVTVPRRMRLAVPGLTVHWGAVSSEDRAELEGLPLTTARRTLWDLAAQVDFITLAALFESARRKDRDLLAVTKDRLKSRHRLPPEVAQAIALIVRDCESRERPFDSYFEVAFWHRWLFNGLERPVPQLKVRDRAGNMYIDFAFPKEKVAVETQGYHGLRDTRGSFDNDAARTLRLGSIGWQVIAVTKTMFREAFPAVVVQIEGTRKSRR